jgi:hypothetical protein
MRKRERPTGSVSAVDLPEKLWKQRACGDCIRNRRLEQLLLTSQRGLTSVQMAIGAVKGGWWR